MLNSENRWSEWADDQVSLVLFLALFSAFRTQNSAFSIQPLLIAWNLPGTVGFDSIVPVTMIPYSTLARYRRALASLGAAFALNMTGTTLQASDHVVSSPDGRLVTLIKLGEQGELTYTITAGGASVLKPSSLGLEREDTGFSTGLSLAGEPKVDVVSDNYIMRASKRRLNTYHANRLVLPLANGEGARMDVECQVSDVGVAFRYLFPGESEDVYRIREERTSYNFPPSARAWIQPRAEAKVGWGQTNPSYEEYYQMDVPVGTPSPLGAGWVYPALFQSGGAWVVISETGLGDNYCATNLAHGSGASEYKVGFPDPRELIGDGPVNPQSTLPWTTPWRIIAIGTLKDIVESTLGTDLATPAAVTPTGDAQPGLASWSWPLLGDANTTYDVQKRFIDYAHAMRWDYCLVDALWDEQIGYDKMRELADYARTRGVRLLVWYNSAGDWNTAPQTPRDKMLTHEARIAEFTRLREMGIAGVKIDFFGGDGQSVIQYYLDILRDSAPYGLLVNFHGSTIPRGWQRTYPHLMTMEAIKGLEYVTFEQSNADQQPSHCAIIPFTRNLWDPMDFTPMVLDKIEGKERRTTSAFELALPVLFTSGITHFAEIPEGMAKAPDYVVSFLRRLPRTWEDVRFVDGYPGRYCVLARRGEGRWIIAGINGEAHPRTVTIDLSTLPIEGIGLLIADGEGGNLSFRQQQVDATGELQVDMPANGGFVVEFLAQ